LPGVSASFPSSFSPRTVLFLEGPASPFLRRVADRLIDAGHRVRHVDFCLGDRVFWSLIVGRRWGERRPVPVSIHFRDRFGAWPAFLARLIAAEGITDVVMLGDGRPVHAAAVEVAMAAGVRIHILEHGYLRPDRLTLEPDGMSGHSRFPRDPDLVRALAAGLPAVDFAPLWRSSFLVYALYDFAYHLPNVFLGPLLHPHYRTHGSVHPLIEYAGWGLKWALRPFARGRLDRTVAAHLCGAFDWFLFPLQLAGDYQILRHAPGGDLFALVEAVLASFAAHADPASRLLFKVHPLDNGLAFWPRRIGRAARRLGIADRVAVIDGGPLDALIAAARGVVLVNSTVGTAALAAGRPLIALGNAVFDMPGLTHQGSLADFWRRPRSPDHDLVDAFFRLLVDRTQLRGGFIGAAAIEAGANAVAARIVEAEERLPIAWRRPRAVGFRHAGELGISLPEG
jgi:capsular polysaccharide export protein